MLHLPELDIYILLPNTVLRHNECSNTPTSAVSQPPAIADQFFCLDPLEISFKFNVQYSMLETTDNTQLIYES